MISEDRALLLGGESSEVRRRRSEAVYAAVQVVHEYLSRSVRRGDRRDMPDRLGKQRMPITFLPTVTAAPPPVVPLDDMEKPRHLPSVAGAEQPNRESNVPLPAAILDTTGSRRRCWHSDQRDEVLSPSRR